MVIGAKNHADEGSFSWYAGWWLDELPLANLRDRRLGLIARTNGLDPAGTNFTVDLGKLRPIGLVSLIGTNLSSTAKWRLLFSRDNVNWFSDTDDMQVWPIVEEFGTLPWGIFHWGGTIATEVEGNLYPINVFYLPEQTLLARYVRVYLIDPNNPTIDDDGIGWLQVARLYVGPTWEPSVNALYPFALGTMDPSRVSYSRGGVTYIDELPRRRVLRFRFSALPEDEIMGQVLDSIDRAKGIVGDLIVIPNPANPLHMHQQAIYGRVAAMSDNVMTFFDQFDREFVVEEFI